MTQGYLSSPKAAKYLGIGINKLMALVDAGEIVAINSSMGHQRPRWLFKVADLDGWAEGRRVEQTKPVRQRGRRREPAQQLIEIY